jgi:hypothetical protein
MSGGAQFEADALIFRVLKAHLAERGQPSNLLYLAEVISDALEPLSGEQAEAQAKVIADVLQQFDPIATDDGRFEEIATRIDQAISAGPLLAKLQKDARETAQLLGPASVWTPTLDLLAAEIEEGKDPFIFKVVPDPEDSPPAQPRPPLNELTAAERLADFHQVIADRLPSESPTRALALRCSNHWSRLASGQPDRKDGEG